MKNGFSIELTFNSGPRPKVVLPGPSSTTFSPSVRGFKTNLTMILVFWMGEWMESCCSDEAKESVEEKRKRKKLTPLESEIRISCTGKQRSAVHGNSESTCEKEIATTEGINSSCLSFRSASVCLFTRDCYLLTN